MSRALICCQCGKSNPLVGGQVGRLEVCFSCHADLHACQQCEFYDVTAYNECREPAADRVTEKSRANFCDFYQSRSGSQSGDFQRSAQVSAAEALFKKK